MNLHYASILDLSNDAYPRKVSGVVFLTGSPLERGYCFGPQISEGASEPVSYFVEHFLKQQAFVDAIVFSGGEPLSQGNALIELCRELDKFGFYIKLNTCGFYPENLNDLLPYVDFVSLDVKTIFEKNAYAEASGFKGDSELLLSNVLRSLAFIERRGQFAIKEIVTTLVPGINDSPEIIREICSQINGFANVYVLKQFDPTAQFVEQSLSETPSASKETMRELAAEAKKIFPKT
ncbi:MAG: radical SAM protein, partial [Candidatus Micrarchaeota archaeon]